MTLWQVFDLLNSNSTLQKDLKTSNLNRASNHEEVSKFSKQNDALLHLLELEVKNKFEKTSILDLD